MTPAIPNANDGPAIEVGVKFRSSLFGHVTAIRYYKGSQHTGTHVGSLWSSSGTRLATATFTNETASGWQQVNLTPPVFINANTTYVASYHSAAGYYAVTPNHFLQATANPPLTALADGTDGQNGIYRYGASAFPNQSYQQSNYWVDVVFVPDTVRPTITAMAPPGGAIDVGVDSNVTATFDETMNPASVNGTTVQLRDPANQLVPAIVTWNPATRTASLNPSIDLDPATTYAAVVRGGAGGVTDLAGNALAADHNWTFTTGTPPPPDNTPPTVTGMAPAPDAFNVLVATNVVATFSEALNPGTVSASTFELRNASGQLVPASVTWDPVALTVTLNPTANLAFGTAYTATAHGGAGAIADLAGNPLAGDVSWSFSTETSFAGVSLWPNPVTPVVPNANDGQPIELGVRFRSSGAGYITGIRFHKSNQNTGTHVGNLYSATGALLASAVFVGESPSGWQQVAFPSPVPIAANTTYVASYHSGAGYYSATLQHFTEATVTGPLTALADGTDGPNGLYRYGSSAFPDQTAGKANYWVDVIFNTELPGPDSTPPVLIQRTPASNAVGVLAAITVGARFNEPIAPATVTTSTMELRAPGNQLVPAAVSWSAATNTAFLDPAANLAFSTTYTVTVRGGAAGMTDNAGNPLPADVSWTFTTEAAPPPPPDEGPGGPILVIADRSNKFTRYYAEILRAEGLNAFATLDLESVDASVLAEYDVAILGEMPLSGAQVAMLEDWVNAGGNLIAMRPDGQLAGLLGLLGTPDTPLAEAYLQVATGAAPGQGIVGQTIQFHGSADRYTVVDAMPVATLFSDAATATINPAVTLRSVGLGHAAAFTFDLARSVVYMRQGNPAWSADERDGFPPIRSDDLFYGAKAGDIQADWVDLNKVAIPQADEQQRLLANLILHMNRNRKPLPRFWYFPFDEKAVVIMTSDNHGNGALASARLDRQLTQDPPGCDVNRWECVRSSMYLYLTAFNSASYQDQGFEIGVHVNTNCENWTAASLNTFFTEQLGGFATFPQFQGLLPPTTVRTHCIAWSDWATHAKVDLQHGIRLDTNYYYWPGGWVNHRPGHFTGSGMPMRFADLDGSMIDVYQAATQITDESGQFQPFTIDSLLDRALGPEGYYGAITANIHSDNGDESLSDAIVFSAQARGVPVISARQMLKWLDGRNSSTFNDLVWSGDVLTFSISVGAGANGMSAMLPTHAAGGRVLTALTHGGSPLPHAVEVVKGVEYAIFPAEPGTYAAAYTIDLDPPVISGLAVNVVSTGSANVSWQTNENASSLVEYGTAPGNLNLSVSAPALVTDRTLGLTGLTGGATYHYRVTSVDPSGNSASSGILSFQAVLDTTPPVVSLVRPNGGERVFAGTPYVIHWNATDTVGVTAVDVEFSSNAGAVYAPVPDCTGLPGTAQTCTWAAPGPITTQGRIRVIARDAAGNSGSATSSANFTVVTGAASLTLTAPITAVSWTIASAQNVTFNHNFGVGQSVAVDVSRDAGATWTTVNAGFVTTNATSGSVPWVVTGPPTAAARARVRWTGNPAVTSTSPVNFGIIDRITITAPNTAVTWSIGSTRSITWNHNLGAAATVNISVSRDSGTTWSVLAANVPNGAATTGTYTWIVNSPASVNARIRITSVDDPGISSVSPVDFTISGTLAITDPTGSSVWSIGSTRAVTWTHNLGAGHTFAIDLSTDNGATYPVVIASGVAGQAATGSFNWVVPGPVTAVARLRVRWTDSAAVNGTSGAFDMVAPVITVTSPNTAVSWGIGGSRAITWTHNLGAVNFDIALSTDGGATYPTTIATGVPASATSGTYTWTVSGPALATARVRVIASSDPNLRDDSAVNFTMANPVLTLTAPTTAVNWAIGTTRAITWNHNLGTLETVEIEKSTDGGATWTSIAAAAPNANTNGTFNWLVAGPTSATARIRVKWTDNPALVSQGAVNFTIANPTLTVTAPNTAVSWAVAASQNITFTHNLGAGIPLNVEVSRDGGATFAAITTVTSTTATSVTVPWVVTAPATTQARIRVVAAALASDMSDVNFIILFTIGLTAPNTAVIWGIGSTRAVTWTHNLGAGHLFNVDLSTDGGATYPTALAAGVAGAAASGTFSWDVAGPASATARVRVSSAADPNIRGQSAVNFTIASPLITLTAPNTAVNWAVGTTRAVTWNHNLGSDETVHIEASTDGGASWATVATAAPNGGTNGTFNWLIPGPTTATARIRVSWTENASVTAQSAVNFTVADPTLAVTAPNTAVTWAIASTQNVTFTHNLGTGAQVTVEVSRDGGATFGPAASFTTTNATSGTVPWVVTGPSTTQARMRVSYGGGVFGDASDVNFTIQ